MSKREAYATELLLLPCFLLNVVRAETGDPRVAWGSGWPATPLWDACGGGIHLCKCDGRVTPFPRAAWLAFLQGFLWGRAEACGLLG